MDQTQDLKEWGKGLNPITLYREMDEFAEELEEIQNSENRESSVLRFSYGDLDNFIEKSSYQGLSISVHHARLKRLLSTAIRASDNRKNALFKNCTDKCLAPVRGKKREDGTYEEKSPTGTSKYTIEYRQQSYTSDEIWQSLETEKERLQELYDIADAILKTHQSKQFQISRLLEQRAKLT